MRQSVLRPAVVLFLSLCVWTAITARSHGQQSSGPALPFPASAWRAIAHGKPAEAEAQARSRAADDPAAVAVLAHIAVEKGQYNDSIGMLRPVANRVPLSDAALELALLLQTLGRRNEAAPLLNVLYRAAGNDQASLTRAARAAAALGDARSANSLFRAASGSASNPALDTAWGLLFLDKYNYPEAVKSFQQALAADPEWAPAHAGLARTLAEDDPPAAAAEATRALEIDPHLADAELLLAQLDLDNTRWDAARERIARVLEFNPSHLDARALAAAITYVRESRQAFDAEVKQTLAINPSFGEIYRVAAELSARNYRFDEAVSLAREAVTLDPENARAHAELGMHLMRTGDETQARQSLERAFKIDPYDKVTFNLLALLDTLDKFVEIREGDIILKLDPAEAPVMREYAMPLAQEALKTLSAKYHFTPKGPILVEIFPKHDDFAVRTLGLPGMIGALGACFGRVVSLDSPHARPSNPFSWQATLWHEMTHVITLQMSNQRIPRWLTEGISEYEETQARPDWGREMEIPFALALERGKALKLADLNSGFTRPDTIALAYYEASLLVDHIVRTYGDAKLQALVKSYGEGLEGNDAIEEVLDTDFDKLQIGFDQYTERTFGALQKALVVPKDVQLAKAPIDELRKLANENPRSYPVQLAYGHALRKAGSTDEAMQVFERAAALAPSATGDDSPRAQMAEIALEKKDRTRAIAELTAFLNADFENVGAAHKLASLLKEAGVTDPARLRPVYERIVALDPFDGEARSALGRMALQRNDVEFAAREFRTVIALKPIDPAVAHTDLAESYLKAGKRDEAKRQTLAALEIAPTYERAQDVLLKLSEARP